MYKCRDFVQWTTSVHGKTYERAGEILVVVPAGKDPRKYIPLGYDLHIRGHARDMESYLISIPGTKTLYWPPVESLTSLSIGQWELLYSQKLYLKTRIAKSTNRQDRQKIISLCNLMHEFYGDRYFENERAITIPAWGRRFHFRIHKGVEYIHEIETFTPAIRGRDELF